MDKKKLTVKEREKNVIRRIAEKWINTHQWTHKSLTPETEKAILKFADFVDSLMEKDQ